MRVHRLVVSNFMGIRDVDITIDPADDSVVISGANGQGKSSLVLAIWAAVQPKGAGVDDPIRHGEHQASVTVDFGEFVVERTWTHDGTEKGKVVLKVRTHDGARYDSPQKKLDAFIGALSFDPLAFKEKSPRDQRDMLKDLAHMDIDPVAMAERREAIFNARTVVNRDLKGFQAQLDATQLPVPGLPAEEISSADVAVELTEAHQVIASNQQNRRDLDRAREKRYDLSQDVLDLERKLDLARLELGAAQAEEDRLGLDEAKWVDPDTSAIEERLRNVETVNTAIRAAQARQVLVTKVDEHKQESEDLTAQIKEIDELVANGMANAELPIEGLAFAADGITFGGIPFDQCSSAEQLRISMAMAIALNPEMRVVYIKDGSLLDSESTAMVKQMAAEHDVQLWLEVVHEGGDMGFTISDGMVVS